MNGPASLSRQKRKAGGAQSAVRPSAARNYRESPARNWTSIRGRDPPILTREPAVAGAQDGGPGCWRTILDISRVRVASRGPYPREPHGMLELLPRRLGVRAERNSDSSLFRREVICWLGRRADCVSLGFARNRVGRGYF